MKKLWPLRTFHGSFAVGRDLLSCSTEYTLPVCFGCALVLARRSLIMEADSGVGAGPAGGGSAFAGVISICFILFVWAIAASRREAQSLNRLPPPSPRASDERRALPAPQHTSSTTRGYEASQNTAQRKSRCEALAGDGEAFGIEPIKPGLLGLRGRKIALGRRLEGSYRD